MILNFLGQLQESKRKPLSELITALGIPTVGITAAKLLEKWFGSMNRLLVASKEELQLVPGTYLCCHFLWGFFVVFSDPYFQVWILNHLQLL